MGTLRVTRRTARKKHECNACLWLRDSLRDMQMTFSEWRSVVRAKQSNCKILPGEQYDEVALSDTGSLTTIRHKPEINDICHKYDIYQE